MLDFPTSPTVGQKYPASPVAGVATYVWDGEKWKTGAAIAKTPVYTDGSAPMTAQLKLVGDPVAAADAARKAYVDAGDAGTMKIAGNQTITGGFKFATYDAGTKSAGTFTPDPFNGNYQAYTNGGAHTLAAPASDCAIDLLVYNGAGAGAITFTGFMVGSNTGDTFATTVGATFIISIRRIATRATYVIKALQ